jgi:hypothetical protein
MSKETGGPAFPDDHGRGMTLRDYFAINAPEVKHAMPLSDEVAYRYRFADAMLAERDKP